MPAQRKLSDKQHKEIIRLYAECGNYSEVARRFGVSVPTIKRHVDGDKETLKIVNSKKQENTLDMLAFMEGQSERIKSIFRNMLEALDNPEKLAKTNPRDIATAFGIIWDKTMQTAPKADDEYLQKAREILGDINGVIK